MLNLYKNYVKVNKTDYIKNSHKLDNIKNFPSSTREWKNSIYVFNKNNLNFIPATSKTVLDLVKSYFYLYNTNLEDKLRKSNIRRRFRRLSSNRIYVSNGTYKHTSNRVIITLYVYNRQKINYTYFIERKFKLFFAERLNKKILLLKNKINTFMGKMEKNKSVVLETLNIENNNKIIYKNLLIKYYSVNIYNKILNTVYRKYKKYFLYKQLLYINKSKFNYNYLSFLSTILKKIYNKNVEFDIVNLKYFYLSSDIFLQSILFKIKKNRRRLIRSLKYLMVRSKINKISKFITYSAIIKNTLSLTSNIDPINYLILENAIKNKKTVKKTALSLIKYKRVTGVRLQAKGRLTRRLYCF